MKMIGKIAKKIGNHISLAINDPEKFGRNILQITNPKLFEDRLLDIMNMTPMHIRLGSDTRVRLNVLDAAWTRSGMTGGPNTTINLALRIAKTGIPIRLVSTVREGDADNRWIAGHAASLLGEKNVPQVSVASAASRYSPLELGKKDIFIATHWTTAYQLKEILPNMPIRKFFYMLQEFEPSFYAWSSNYARCIETLHMDFIPIINEEILAQFFYMQPFCRFVGEKSEERAIIFQPAVDRDIFYPPKNLGNRPKRLLFYARPTNTRNAFGLGLLALRQVATDPAFAGWEFVAIGGRGAVPEMALGGGHKLVPAGWAGYSEYAASLRDADVLLCPMISPHTSYPVLEMAATGGISITNTFVTKTAERLEALSPDIIPVEASVEGFAAGLRAAAARVGQGVARVDRLNLPSSWADALEPTVRRVTDHIHRLAGG